jgi:hypothetical protein
VCKFTAILSSLCVRESSSRCACAGSQERPLFLSGASKGMSKTKE